MLFSLDMVGPPNRVRHIGLGSVPYGQLTALVVLCAHSFPPFFLLVVSLVSFLMGLVSLVAHRPVSQ